MSELKVNVSKTMVTKVRWGENFELTAAEWKEFDKIADGWPFGMEQQLNNWVAKSPTNTARRRRNAIVNTYIAHMVSK